MQMLYNQCFGLKACSPGASGLSVKLLIASMLCDNTLGAACFSSRRLVTLSALKYGQKKDLNLGRSLEFGHYGQEKVPNSGRQLGLERPVRKTSEISLSDRSVNTPLRGSIEPWQSCSPCCKSNGGFLCKDLMRRS